ncbi:MAG: NAD(P)/FAD-dependent oxidoreductase [Chloroflexi bacterium]|nr:NAD(P)/FAD-dependent oxidoreductase [Chloroflexota bacterium]
MSQDFDAIVIGGGHNSLTAVAYLAKAGMKVAVFEQRGLLGGAASTEELFPGFRFNTGLSDAGLLLPDVIDDLGLTAHGLDWLEAPALAFAPLGAEKSLTLWQDLGRTTEELGQHSKSDAQVFARYTQQNAAFGALLQEMAKLAPPSLQYKPLPLLLAWAKVAIRARRLGGRRMMEFMRVLPMGAARYLDEWFESVALKGLLGAVSVSGLLQGPRAAGTAFMLLYQQMGSTGGYMAMKTAQGGVGAVSAALASAAGSYGAEIHTGVRVAHILSENGKALGVELVDGSQVLAKVVLSGAEVRHTLVDLVGASKLAPSVMRRLRALKLRGSTASVHLALSGLPKFSTSDNDNERLTGDIVICPSLDYAEQAYDDAKYGRFSARPILIARIPSLLDSTLAPDGEHTLSITLRYAPYHLRGSDWGNEKERLGDLAVKVLSEHAPGLKKLIKQRKVITPLDYERDYGLTEGSMMHGQMSLDQLVMMRPVPGFVGYRTPIEGLYINGAGAHPGGGVTGAPGRNAARQVLKEI